MADNFLDLLIQHYLRGGRDTTALRGQLHEQQPARVTGRATTPKPLPNQLGVSVVPMTGMMGNNPATKASGSAIAWAQNITQVLGQIDPDDQTDIVDRYGKFKSMFVDGKQMIPGMFYSFSYRAKTTNQYDMFPLVLVLDRTPTSVLAMNFHYLPPKLRFGLFESMMPLIAPLPVFQLSRIFLTYQQLTKRRMVGKLPTIKRYNYTHIRGRALFISPLEWAVALAYPSERFIGTTSTKVWTESRRNLS
jgi:hypothetical protein